MAEENESGTIVGGLAVRPRCEPAMRIETRQDATMRCVFGWLYSWRPPVERTERKQNMTLQRGLPKSALGHKRTSAPQKVMSALPPKADMCGANEMPRAHPRRIIPRSITGNLSNNIIQKGLAFRCDRSASALASGACFVAPGSRPAGLRAFAGLRRCSRQAATERRRSR